MPSPNSWRAGSSAVRLRRSLWALSGVWFLAWSLGIASLAWVATRLHDELRHQKLDTDLIYYTTAVYGLTWFDDDGHFHRELLEQEAALKTAPADLWVLPTDSEAEPYLHPNAPRFAVSELRRIATRVVRSDRMVTRHGQDDKGNAYRLRAIPTYLDSAPETAHAAIIAIADPEPGLAAHREFRQRIGWIAVALGLVGIGVGVWLARISLKPLANSIAQRELFLTAAAHELRTPVSALRSVAESIARPAREPVPEGRDPAIASDPESALRRVRVLADETSEVVENLLTFARLDADTITLNRERLRLDLLVEAQLPEDLPGGFEAVSIEYEGDAGLLAVAIRNLIRNGQRHAHGQGLRVQVTNDGIEITDRGPGFPDALLSHAGRVWDLRPSTGGAGVGLAIAGMVAEKHGGSLELENRGRGGARVRLRLGPPSRSS